VSGEYVTRTLRAVGATPPPIVQQADAQLLELDARVDHAEDDGIRARWEFGRALLRERVGKQLPAGRLDQVSAKTGKSRQEIGYRMTFADRFPTEAEVSNAVGNFGSWHAIVNEALGGGGGEGSAGGGGGGLGVHGSSERHDWETPQDLFDLLDAEFGFDLDVCATKRTAKCARYFAPADDGLAQVWRGTCWMNPPYGGAIEEWVAKAAESARAGATVVCLVPARVDTGWWWDHCRYGEVRFLRGRLHFDDGASGAPFPSAVVVLGRAARVVWWEAWRS
jgi:phage N-6-adenine-methyltransferase